MDIYFELLKYPVFSANSLSDYYASVRTARQALARLVKAGRVARIRNDLYTCINGETLAPMADKYQIASAITETSYISHHTAMEYHGITNQVYYDVYVTSATKFQSFSFEGYNYCYVPAKFFAGVIEPAFSGGIRVTDMERTVIDCLKDFEKIGGMEELLDNLSGIQALNEEKLLKYLSLYQNKFLYQKVGCILERFNEKLRLSSHFFHTCKEQIGNSKRYLTKENCEFKYDKIWRLMVPAYNKKGDEGIDATL